MQVGGASQALPGGDGGVKQEPRVTGGWSCLWVRPGGGVLAGVTGRRLVGLQHGDKREGGGGSGEEVLPE